MRLFIGISVPAKLHAHCRKLQGHFPGMRRLGEFHLTIQFLGDNIGEQFLPRIIEALNSIDFEPFEVQLGKARRFPNKYRPNGAWIDCDGGPELKSLADRIRKAMDKVGFRPDKPFAAHITLGRYKKAPPPPFGSKGEQSKPEPKVEERSFKVDRFFLMESHLAPEGAKYKILATFLA